MKTLKRFFTASRIIALSFALLIVFGGLLLALPISSAQGNATPFIDALFTSASASCVTGLSVYDTLSYWSAFGKIVILCLIQIGGIGCMTLVTLIVKLLSGAMSVRSESLLMQSVGVLSRRDVWKTLRGVIIFTFGTEAIGMLLLAFRWVPMLGFGRGLASAFFTSVSAFCNAGFDLFGDLGAGSLSHFYADTYSLLVLSFLIICGGIGFLVWSDLFHCGLHFKKWSFHTKAVLFVTGFLLLAGTFYFYLSEWNAAFSGMSTETRWLSAFFQSATTRTAGFYSVEQSTLSNAGIIGTILLMCIGGSPGSTAGGMKTTTLLVLFLSLIATARKNREISLFRKRITEDTIRQASSILVIYLGLIITATALICLFEPVLTLSEVLFEVVSAIATVGLSLGISPELSVASKLILTVLMYIGRIGGLTFAFVLSEKRRQIPLTRPAGEILVG